VGSGKPRFRLSADEKLLSDRADARIEQKMDYPLYLAGILALGIAAQWVAWRFRLPAIVLLLLFGILLGKFTSGEPGPDEEMLFAMVSLAVGIILFEGGLSLNFREIYDTRGAVVRLVSIGLVISWLLTSWFAYTVQNSPRRCRSCSDRSLR